MTHNQYSVVHVTSYLKLCNFSNASQKIKKLRFENKRLATQSGFKWNQYVIDTDHYVLYNPVMTPPLLYNCT